MFCSSKNTCICHSVGSEKSISAVSVLTFPKSGQLDRVSNVSSPEKRLKILGKFLKVLFGLIWILFLLLLMVVLFSSGVFSSFFFFFSYLDPIFSRKMIPFSLFIFLWTMPDFLPLHSTEKEILANNSVFILFCPRKPPFIWCRDHLQERWARIELLPTTTVPIGLSKWCNRRTLFWPFSPVLYFQYILQKSGWDYMQLAYRCI